MGIIESVIIFVKNLILDLGYPGIVLLMALESANVPLPSEIILPFSGWLVYEGKMDIVAASLAGAIGCTLGSIISYIIGLYGGRAFVVRYGRYVLFDERALVAAERLFSKYGDAIVFLSRLLPIIRTFISLPAGMAKMNFSRFVILSFFGSLPWCFILVYVGFALGPSWETILEIFRGFDLIIVVIVLVVLIWFLLRRKNKMKKQLIHQEE
ncbi:MAG: DedA family protein [Methanomassiliicoccales archaeon]|jgi:membrane protein DedA with SNARE-associated domain|nr:DedA family protein [Methanomassiliicoccales archaeon]